jgi:hypothetical protein
MQDQLQSFQKENRSLSTHELSSGPEIPPWRQCRVLVILCMLSERFYEQYGIDRQQITGSYSGFISSNEFPMTLNAHRDFAVVPLHAQRTDAFGRTHRKGPQFSPACCCSVSEASQLKMVQSTLQAVSSHFELAGARTAVGHR